MISKTTATRHGTLRWAAILASLVAVVIVASPPSVERPADATSSVADVCVDDRAASWPCLAATATAHAKRTSPPTAAASTGVDLVVVGDSLASVGKVGLADALASMGWTPLIDATAGRSIVYEADARFSGVARVSALRAAGIDPRVWVVELGTNDVYFVGLCGCADLVAASDSRIELMIDAIGPGHEIYWIGPQRFDQRSLTIAFNQALRNKVASGDLAGVVEWSVLSQSHRAGWFTDDAHLSPDGYTAWIAAIVATLGTTRFSPDVWAPRAPILVRVSTQMARRFVHPRTG